MIYLEFFIDSVCKKGSIFLWDLVQEDICVRLFKIVIEFILVYVYSNKYIYEFEMYYRFRKLINCLDVSVNL